MWRRRVAVLVLVSLVTAAAAAGALAAPTVTGIRIGEHDDMTRLVLDLTEATTFRIFTLTGPDRMVIDLPPVRWGMAERNLAIDRAGVSRVRLGQFRPDTARIVLDLIRPATVRRTFVLAPSEGGSPVHRLVVDFGPVPLPTLRAAGQPAETLKQEPKAPTADKPAEPLKQEPKAPTADKPAEPLKQEPKAPTADKPAEPARQEPKAPTADKPAEPLKLEPKAPTADKPAEPLKQEPKAPTADKPAEPAEQERRAAPGAQPAEPVEGEQREAHVDRPAEPAPPVRRAAPREPPPLPQLKPRAKPVRPLIAVDAGHGGRDPGAVSASGLREKTVVLTFAREFRAALEASGRYRAVLTRNSDHKIGLRRRVVTARNAGADLFLSIHVDRLDERSVRGASVYTLSAEASDTETAALATRENKADIVADVDLSEGYDPEVAKVLISLVQQNTMNCSAALAALLVPALDRVAPLVNRPHRFGDFRVLKAPDIPSVLIELGFLSNDRDAERMRSRRHRAALAGAIIEALDNYYRTPC